ncbi:MAG: flagellar filament capping protein FliD [Candidatus Hydrogenedentes bacterium]|nr:flagellar filament capping protein FliD [Candidatus Hydrogenedentota bacterium]
MASTFGVSGLASGIDTDAIVSKLMALEQAPIRRLEDKISSLKKKEDAIKDIRNELLTLFQRAQDFTLGMVFDRFKTVSSDESVLTTEISGAAATRGSYDVDITQLASATVATSNSYLGQVVNPTATLDSAGFSTEITAGTFTLNGVSITVDPTTDTLNDVLADITANTNLTATFNATTNKIEIENDDPGSTAVINVGSTSDTSNFIEAAHLNGANQGGTPTKIESTVDLAVLNSTDTLDELFGVGTVVAGDFRINGVAITITDPSTQTLEDIIASINGSEAGVLATFDTATDKLQITSKTLGSRTIDFQGGTSGFLTAVDIDNTSQTAGNDAQFSVDGTNYTRNSNSVGDVIGGVTLNLLSAGTATVTVSDDTDSAVSKVNEMLDAFNESVKKIDEQVARDGVLYGDGTIRSVTSQLQSIIFSSVTDATGKFSNLLEVGISTGDSFESDKQSEIQLDEAAFRDAIQEDPTSVENLFTNSGDSGIADLIETYLRDITSTTGFLQARAGSNGTIETEISDTRDRIDMLETRLSRKEQRLKDQFRRMEMSLTSFQSTSQFLAQAFR